MAAQKRRKKMANFALLAAFLADLGKARGCSTNSLFIHQLIKRVCLGWREPGNKTLQIGRIFLRVLFKKRVPDQEGRPAGQR